MSVARSIHVSRLEKLESHPARITGNFEISGNFRINYELVTLRETELSLETVCYSSKKICSGRFLFDNSDKLLCLSAIEKHYLAFL